MPEIVPSFLQGCTNIALYVHCHHTFLTSLFIYRCLGCFYGLLSGTISTSLWYTDWISVEYLPRSGIAGFCGSSVLIFFFFGRIATPFSLMALLIYISTKDIHDFTTPGFCQYLWSIFLMTTFFTSITWPPFGIWCLFFY